MQSEYLIKSLGRPNSPDRRFKPGGSLSAGDLAREVSVLKDEEGKLKDAFDVASIHFAVVNGPALCGKTTLIDRGVELFDREFTEAKEDVEHIEINFRELYNNHLIEKAQFMAFVGEKLSSKDRSPTSVLDMIASRVSNKRTFLVFNNTWALEERLKQTLLNSFRNKNEELRGLGVDVALEADVYLFLLTAGKDSKFPTTQICPSEFDRDIQSAFCRSGFDHYGREITNDALETLWSLTHGDKYLTQAICARTLYADNGFSDRAVIDRRQIETVADAYADDDPVASQPSLNTNCQLRDGLLSRFNTLSDIVDHKLEGCSIDEKLNDIERRWKFLPKDFKEISYRFGLVRSDTSATAKLRAPWLQRMFWYAQKRVHGAKSIFDLKTYVDAVDQEDRESLTVAAEIIRGAAAEKSLAGLRFGYCKKIDEEAIEVLEGHSLKIGLFQSEWQVKVGRYNEGDEFAFLQFAKRERDHHISSRLLFFSLDNASIPVVE